MIGHRLALASLLFATFSLVINLNQNPIARAETEIALVNVDGHLVEFSQFRIANPNAPHCFFYHYHAASGDSVTALNGQEIPDPDRFGCGYGIISALGAGEITLDSLPDADFDGLPDSVEIELILDPNDPDSDGDNIIDFIEDHDSDGQGNGDEVVKGGNPADPADGIQANLEKLSTTFTKFPVIINVLKNSEADVKGHIIEAVKRANLVLKDELNLMLKVVRVNVFLVNGPDDGSGGGTAGDGIIRFDGSGKDELNKIANYGERELNKNEATKGKGMKITVAKQIEEVIKGKTVHPPGSSAENVRTINITQRGENNNSTSIDLTASTIVHEIGHTFGLKHPKATASTADDKPGNMMTPSDSLKTKGDGLGRDSFVKSSDPDKGLTNLELTDEQKSKVVKSGKLERWGIQKTTKSPAEETHFQFGSSDDDAGDQIGSSVGFVDLISASVDSEVENDVINTVIFLGQSFPSAEPFDVTLSLGFDTDANPVTGSPFPSFLGIEKEVIVHVFRSGLGEEIQTYAVVTDHTTFQNSVIFDPIIIQTVEAQGDLVDSEAVPYTDELIMRIPKTAMSPISAEDVPVKISIRDLPDSFFPFSNFDSSSLVFDTDLFTEMPDFDIGTEFANPGDSIPFEVSSLVPQMDHRLLIDETPILEFTTDSDGHFEGVMDIPLSTGDGAHFLTAENNADPEETNELAGIFAFSAIRIEVPEAVDTDGDGLTDDEENTLGTDPNDTDTDDDTLSDFDEVVTYGTNPTSSDSDGDSVSDGADGCKLQAEIVNGFEDDDGCPDTAPVDGQIAIIGTPTFANDLSVEVSDADQNFDTQSPDVIASALIVDVDRLGGDTEVFDLAETGDSTNTFRPDTLSGRVSVTFVNSPSDVIPDNGILELAPGDVGLDIVANYNDPLGSSGVSVAFDAITQINKASVAISLPDSADPDDTLQVIWDDMNLNDNSMLMESYGFVFEGHSPYPFLRNGEPIDNIADISASLNGVVLDFDTPLVYSPLENDINSGQFAIGLELEDIFANAGIVSEDGDQLTLTYRNHMGGTIETSTDTVTISITPPPLTDTDSDGVPDSSDNCDFVANADQANADGDLLGDVCDPFPLDQLNDTDEDGVSGHIDNCPSVSNPDQADTDVDGIGDMCDDDRDGDSVPNSDDACPDEPGNEPNGCPPVPLTIGELITHIRTLNLPQGVETGLIAPLKNAQELLDDDNASNNNAACGKLGAFVNQINAKEKNGQLTAEQAAELRNSAQEIETNIGC